MLWTSDDKSRTNGPGRGPRNPLPPALSSCRRGDLNPYALFGHQALNLARLPIPPLRLADPLYLPEPTPTLVASKVPKPFITRPVTRADVTVWNWNWATGSMGIWSRTSFSAAW